MADRIYLSVGETADALGIRPRVITDLFYARKLSTERCPIIAGRRLIPRDFVPEIERVLREQTPEPEIEPSPEAASAIAPAAAEKVAVA